VDRLALWGVQAVLNDCELFWRDHQKWLEGCGYSLRPRYTPGWVPSWPKESTDWYHYEDAQGQTVCSPFFVFFLGKLPHIF
jgi:hypothetical protein